MTAEDTITAISSAAGFAPRMIVRLSGPSAWDAVRSFGHEPTVGAMDAELFVDGLQFKALVLAFAGPRSVTGEDVIELHLPGNPHLARRVLRACLDHGARLAGPGEFTARAFFNGKLTLDAAEGVGAAVGATNVSELRAARQLMAGTLAERLRPVMNLLTETLALTEVGIDFTEEDVTFLAPGDANRRVENAVADLSRLLDESPRLERLSRTPVIVLAGRPNVGKSTLLNALAEHDRVVTSDIAGTTRDVIGVEIALPGGIVEIRDVAGLETAIGDIEIQMQAQATRAADSADVLVLVRDAETPDPPLPRGADLTVTTKQDLHGAGVSAVTGHGIADLRQQLSDRAFGTERVGFALNERHRQEIAAAVEVLRLSREHADLEELLAADLRSALDHLGAVLGKVTPDDILGQVFGRFCVGK